MPNLDRVAFAIAKRLRLADADILASPNRRLLLRDSARRKSGERKSGAA